ncbi:MAG: sce7726 family protein [Solobacterium sp.]|nr:sce7726 family protein [Solobacterium sp.]
MSEHIRHDRDIREDLFEFLENCYGRVRFLEELTVGRARADIVMVTPNALYGIEIKSDADTYTRLPAQVRNYNKFFDYNFIAAGSTHAHHAAEHVPEHWGIISMEVVDGKADFYIVRLPRRNPKCALKNKLSILWRPELAEIQQRNGMFRYRERSKKFVQEKILEKIEAERLHEEISAELFERDYTMIEKQIDDFRRGIR